MTEVEEVSTEVDSKAEGDMEVEVDTGVEVEGGEDISRGIMIDHWIGGLLRKDVVGERRNVRWVLPDRSRKRREKRCM
jgi:hypothetical protein